MKDDGTKSRLTKITNSHLFPWDQNVSQLPSSANTSLYLLVWEKSRGGKKGEIMTLYKNGSSFYMSHTASGTPINIRKVRVH